MKTGRTLLLSSLLIALFAVPSFAQLKVAADGKVGVGTTNPTKKLEVLGTVAITNNDNFPSNKQSNFQMRHYSDPDKNFNFFLGQCNNGVNQVLFGGGAGNQLSATVVGFLTTNDANVQSAGTERMRIIGTGEIRMNTAGNAGGFTDALNLITGTASKPGGGVWATASDARLKTNVHPYTDGLEQVMKIKPVFFQYKPETGYTSDKEYVGIIAQEMQKIAPYTVEEKTVHIEQDDKTTKLPEKILTYDGSAVTYMLINAIQEQQSMIQDRDARIEELEARLDRIERILTSSDVTVTNNGTAITNVTLEATDAATLKQNAPNPFSQNTAIEYTLPKTSFNKAFLQISNLQGAVLRKVDLPNQAGYGKVNIHAKEFPAGEYVYSLIIDGKVIDTKKMVLSN